MRVLYSIVAVLVALLLLVIPDQAHAIPPMTQQIRSILSRSRPSHPGRLLNMIMDLQLEGKLGLPLDIADNRHTLTFDNNTCIGDVGDMIWTALTKAKELAEMAESAAGSGSAELFSHVWVSHAKEARQKVASNYASALININELMSRYEAPPNHTIPLYCTNHKPANATVNQSCAPKDTTAFIDGLKTKTTSIVFTPAFYSCLPMYRTCDNEHGEDYTTLRDAARIPDPKFKRPTLLDLKKKEKTLKELQRRKIQEWQKLTTEQRLVSADTYEYYAHAVALFCPDGTEEMRALSRNSSRVMHSPAPRVP